MNMKTLEREMMALPLLDRLWLAERMLASAESDMELDYDEAWDQEIRSRISQLDQGEAALLSCDDVISTIDRQLRS